MILSKQKNIFAFYKDGKKHDSPNAGHPITAMALAIGVKLGGDTSYFGKVKHKPKFGEGREVITKEDVKNTLKICF
jgi:adenosylcobinamide-phosphate synthase